MARRWLTGDKFIVTATRFKKELFAAPPTPRELR